MAASDELPHASHHRTICFDGWVLRADLRELTKDGRRTHLQDQPLQVLCELLAHPGELVTREQLIARLWPERVVSFDTGLNSAVRKLRIALQDEADGARYIETVPRKGYRFIGTIEPWPDEQSVVRLPASPPGVEEMPSPERMASKAGVAPEGTSWPPSLARWYRRRSYTYLAAAGAGLLLVAGLTASQLRRDAVSTAVALPVGSVPVLLHSRTITITVAPLRSRSNEQADSLLALGVTDLVRFELTELEGIRVVASTSTAGTPGPHANADALGAELGARYLLRGSVARVGDRLNMAVELVDVPSGSRVWSQAFDRKVTDARVVLQDLVAGIADTLHVAIAASARDVSARQVNLDAYSLYAQGEQFMASHTIADTERAIGVFERVTVLDPTFARGYLALAQAVGLAAALRLRWDQEGEAANARAKNAIDRALELDPTLAEAWIERARLTMTDPIKAEELYHKALALAPNSAIGYQRFSEFLMDQERYGEALVMIDRARDIDPLAPGLRARAAYLLRLSRSDYAGAERLLREALALNPSSHQLLTQLAEVHFAFGEAAEGIRLAEKSMTLDPESGTGRYLTATGYLEVDDPQAALAVCGELRQPIEALVQIAQYQHDPHRAAELAHTANEGWRWADDRMLAEALRDGAMATHDYASVIKRLESENAKLVTRGTRQWSWNTGTGLVYAHTLVLAGEVDRGHALAASILAWLDKESVGRTAHALSRARAAAFAILGDEEHALQELEASVRVNQIARWWYTADLDPLYARLRRDPRFQALAAKAQEHRRDQRMLVNEMRRRAEIPIRTSAAHTSDNGAT